jgi:hypothetical protein
MAGKLKPLEIERETRPGKYVDGDGLYLIVAGANSRSWSYRYYKDGKQRWHGLFKDVSLKDRALPAMQHGCGSRVIAACPAWTTCRRGVLLARRRGRLLRRPYFQPSKNARRHISVSTGRPGARSIAISGHHPSSGMRTLPLGNSRSQRSNPATFMNCCARSGLRSGRPPTEYVAGSKPTSAYVYWLAAQREILATTLNSTEAAVRPSMHFESATTKTIKKPRAARSGKSKSRAA